jgi:magnesium chelatase family protein
VLYLDEALQFRADALEALRGPIDAGAVTIARVEGVLALPARFMLLASFNPCPCGWFGVDRRECTCEDGMRRRYQARLSGPMRDRLDMIVDLEPVGSLRHARHSETSRMVAARVATAVAVQAERQSVPNAEIPANRLDERIGFPVGLRALLDTRGRQLGLSMRRLHRAARVARTIADLTASNMVRPEHLDEALLHRPKDVRP